MIEQWFLDLDGVRSGPYQTPEVMSLVAEGEILPHHRIATGLSAAHWITILDWRLDQAKLSQKTKPVPIYTERSEVSHAKFDEVEITNPEIQVGAKDDISNFSVHAPAKIELESQPVETKPATVHTPVAAPAAPVQLQASTNPFHPELTPASDPAPHKELPKAAKGSGDTAHIKRPGAKADAVESLINTASATQVNLVAPITSSAVSSTTSSAVPPTKVKSDKAVAPSLKDEAIPGEPTRSRRDPMAEMFDVLQKTKQKREQKQNHPSASGISIEQDSGSPAKSFHLGRTLMIGGGITLIGFALGQVFQQQATPVHEPTASGTPKPFVTPQARPTTEVLDRSTDKLTIRGSVERKPDPTPAKPTPHAAPPKTVQAANERSENAQTEKELEELRHLKKELEELKNLKNNTVDEQSVIDPEGDGFDAVDANGNPVAPGNPVDPQTNNPNLQQPLGR